MMKGLILVLAVLMASGYSEAKLKCELQNPDDMCKTWIDMNNKCIAAVKKQIQTEINASMQYLAMGAHFSRDTINRPGFAEFFFKAATEERDHSTKLIEYLLMRGELEKVSELLKLSVSRAELKKTEWDSAVEALNDALALESTVTKKIRNVIEVCESAKAPNDDTKVGNDYHLVDYLTGEFLEEQYHGQRELAGMISTLSKMQTMHGPIGEFLYDKKIAA